MNNMLDTYEHDGVKQINFQLQMYEIENFKVWKSAENVYGITLDEQTVVNEEGKTQAVSGNMLNYDLVSVNQVIYRIFKHVIKNFKFL